MGWDEAGYGAAGGAAVGSAILPGWGTAIGGALGGALGYFDDPAPPPTVGTNPYQADWNSLIQMLRARAMGQGGSTAGYDYLAANNRGQRQVAGLTAGGSPSGAMEGARAMEQMTENQAGGYARARAQEMSGASDALASALSGANAAQDRRQQMSIQEWATQNGLDMAKLQALAGLGGGLASILGHKSGGGGGDSYYLPGYNQSYNTTPDQYFQQGTVTDPNGNQYPG
jgi:hypothetical protein